MACPPISPISPSSSMIPLTLSFQGHVKLHHVTMDTVLMQLLGAVQKRFAMYLLHAYTSFRLSFYSNSIQYQIADQDDWSQYLTWIMSLQPMVTQGIMPLIDWQRACTIHIEAVEMSGINPINNSIVTSPTYDISQDELISFTLPQTHDGYPTPALDVASTLLFDLAHDEEQTSQHEMETLLEMTEQASSSSSSSSGSPTPVDMEDLVTQQQHILEGFDIVPQPTWEKQMPLVMPPITVPADSESIVVIPSSIPTPTPTMSTLPLPMSLPTTSILTSPTLSYNSPLLPSSSSDSIPAPAPTSATSTSTSSTPTSRPASTSVDNSICRSSLGGRASRIHPRAERHRTTDTVRYARVSSSLSQLKSLISTYTEENPDEMYTPVVMENRNGKERKRKISHRVKTIEDTKKMILGLKRQQRELKAKLAAAEERKKQQQQQQQQLIPDVAIARSMYISVCLSALINPHTHELLNKSGILVYRSRVNELLTECTYQFATNFGYQYDEIYDKDLKQTLGQTCMMIEWDGMDITRELTQQWIGVMQRAQGTDALVPKTEAWWKARYGMIFPFLMRHRHSSGDFLYNIYYCQYQCCLVTTNPYLVCVAAIHAQVRVPQDTINT